MNFRMKLLFAIACLIPLLVLPINTFGTKPDGGAREIRIIIPFKEGGGSDTWARFLAPFLSKHLPDKPIVLVRNVPGGGSTKGANLYARGTKNDGSSILGTSASTQFAYLLGDSRVRYDYKDWMPLLVSQTGGVVYVSPKLGIKNANELSTIREVRLVYGSQGVTSVDIVPMLAFDFLGLNVKPIFGIRGRAIGRLAFERGEANIDFQTTAAYLQSVQPMVVRGEAIPLFSLGTLSIKGELVRDPNFPNLPHYGEVYQHVTGKQLDGIAWQSWLALFTAGFASQDILVVPRSTEKAVIEQYIRAIGNIQYDPEFVMKRSQAIGQYQHLIGVDALKFYELSTNIDKRHKTWIQNWLRDKYQIKLKRSS